MRKRRRPGCLSGKGSKKKVVDEALGMTMAMATRMVVAPPPPLWESAAQPHDVTKTF